jgi:hypothetical protein
MIKRYFVLALSLFVTLPVAAEDTSTDLGIYLFATAIEGEAQIRNVSSDVDVGFDDMATWPISSSLPTIPPPAIKSSRSSSTSSSNKP